ncbi:MAG: hypothetical protein RLZZ546_3257 [Bacteroidota bacterium]|jgi:hypothetical protein
MNKIKITLIILSFFAITNAKSQSTISIYTGLTYGKSPDKTVTPTGTGHYGYLVGSNLILFDDGLHFLFTGEYGKMNLLPEKEMIFFKRKHLSFVRAKGGIGFDLYKFNAKARLRSKLQGNVFYVYRFDGTLKDATPAQIETGYTTLNEAVGGLSTGLGFTYGKLDIDIEYEKGYFNIYYEKLNSKFDFITLTTGVRF